MVKSLAATINIAILAVLMVRTQGAMDPDDYLTLFNFAQKQPCRNDTVFKGNERGRALC
jgi:hypothetical protein